MNSTWVYQNPTFYIKQKKITEFYIGNGGGNGSKLKWIDKKWIVTKMFDVDYQINIWKITYPLEMKTENITRPFQMIPPKEILETKIKE